MISARISLSDNLKPWDADRAAAAGGGRRPASCIALYNPISKARPWQLGRAFESCARSCRATTPVIFGRAAGRPDERIAVAPLAEADAAHGRHGDLRHHRLAPRPGSSSAAGPAPLVYTPRFVGGGGR